MGRLIVSANLSLDGVVQDPSGDEGTRHGGWFDEMNPATRADWAEAGLTEALACDGILFGHRSYEFFAARWPSREGAWADRLRALPKYVVASSALTGPSWVHTSVIGVDDIPELEGDIVVYGSARLIDALLERDLVDELRLFVFPVILGGGRRLFGPLPDRRPMRLDGVRTVGDSLVLSTYLRAR